MKNMKQQFLQNLNEETINTTYKNLHFSCKNETYNQIDGVVMGSPLGPVLANIFMAEPENILFPNFDDHPKNWGRFVDDTFFCIKHGLTEYVLSVLTSFHNNIKFIFVKFIFVKEEKNNFLTFLDGLLIKDCEKMNTTVYRKGTHKRFYLHWELFSPITWKQGTLKSLISTAYMFYSKFTRKRTGTFKEYIS